MESKNPIQSAERIFLILETIAELKSAGLMELSSRVQLHKSTVHRMLLSLIQMGYVKQNEDSGKYSPTFKLVEIAGKILEGVDEVSLVHPYLEKLSSDSKETIHLVQRSDSQVVYIDKVEPQYMEGSSIRMASRIGLARPMYCTAVGKVILSELSLQEVKDIWDRSTIEKKTEYTNTSFDKLLTELELIKKLGYAIDNEENETGVRCIAVCIINHKGKVNSAFSISGPTVRMTDDRIKELSKKILITQREISELLRRKGPF